MKQFSIRHIVSIVFLAIFFFKGMAGIMPLLSSQLNDKTLVELVNSAESEEAKNFPESKHEGEPNEYFISHSAGATDICLLYSQQKNVIAGSSSEQPGYGSVPTPPPDQAIL